MFARLLPILVIVKISYSFIYNVIKTFNKEDEVEDASKELDVTIGNLPIEIVEKIIFYLEPIDVLSASLCCLSWNAVVRKNKRYWRRLCERNGRLYPGWSRYQTTKYNLAIAMIHTHQKDGCFLFNYNMHLDMRWSKPWTYLKRARRHYSSYDKIEWQYKNGTRLVLNLRYNLVDA